MKSQHTFYLAIVFVACDPTTDSRTTSNRSLEAVHEDESQELDDDTEAVLVAEVAERADDAPAHPSASNRFTADVRPRYELASCYWGVEQTTTVGATEVSADCGIGEVNGSVTACECNSTQSDRYIRSGFPVEANGTGVDHGDAWGDATSCKCRFSAGLSNGNTYEAYALCCFDL